MPLKVIDGTGAVQSLPMWVDPAYSCFVAGIVPGATPTTVWQFTGVANVVIRVKRIWIELRAGSAGGGTKLSLNRRSSAASGGTPVNDGTYACQHDINDAASSIVAASIVHYTAFPTAGTLVNQLWYQLFYLAGTSTDQTMQTQTIDFCTNAAKPIVLRGTSDFLTIDSTTALGAAQSLDIGVTWEEATT